MKYEFCQLKCVCVCVRSFCISFVIANVTGTHWRMLDWLVLLRMRDSHCSTRGLYEWENQNRHQKQIVSFHVGAIFGINEKNAAQYKCLVSPSFSILLSLKLIHFFCSFFCPERFDEISLERENKTKRQKRDLWTDTFYDEFLKKRVRKSNTCGWMTEFYSHSNKCSYISFWLCCFLWQMFSLNSVCPIKRKMLYRILADT